MPHATPAAEPTTEPSGTVYEDAGRLVYDLGRRSKAIMSQVVAELGLTPPQAWALRSLEQPLAMGDLADRLFCDASYVTAIVDALEQAGLAERRPDPADRRVRQIVRTDHGREVTEEISRQMRCRHPLFGALDEDEIAQLVELLRKV